MANLPHLPPPLLPPQPPNQHKTSINRPSTTPLQAIPGVLGEAALPQAELSLAISDGWGLRSTPLMNPDRFNDNADEYNNLW